MRDQGLRTPSCASRAFRILAYARELALSCFAAFAPHWLAHSCYLVMLALCYWEVSAV